MLATVNFAKILQGSKTGGKYKYKLLPNFERINVCLAKDNNNCKYDDNEGISDVYDSNNFESTDKGAKKFRKNQRKTLTR